MASSSPSHLSNYAVFLSFRGEDTRKTFIDHFYTTLKNRGIHTFKDDEKLRQGEHISPSLFNAIERSQIALLIFSKNYADSSWCLEELTHIMKCKDEGKLTVIPIFYDVVPSDVRKQEGDFGKGFAKQEARNSYKAEIWRNALIRACGIVGWDIKNMANGHESRAINQIVDEISKKVVPVTSDVDELIVELVLRVELEDVDNIVDDIVLSILDVWNSSLDKIEDNVSEIVEDLEDYGSIWYEGIKDEMKWIIN